MQSLQFSALWWQIYILSSITIFFNLCFEKILLFCPLCLSLPAAGYRCWVYSQERLSQLLQLHSPSETLSGVNFLSFHSCSLMSRRPCHACRPPGVSEDQIRPPVMWWRCAQTSQRLTGVHRKGSRKTTLKHFVVIMETRKFISF